jgi:hypothetical protein
MTHSRNNPQKTWIYFFAQALEAKEIFGDDGVFLCYLLVFPGQEVALFF